MRARDEGADQLAGGAAGEYERQRQPDGRQARALPVSTNGRNTGTHAGRAASMPIESSTWNAKRGRAPCASSVLLGNVWSVGFRAIARRQHEDRHGGDDATARAARARPPRITTATRRHRRPVILPIVAGEIVGAEAFIERVRRRHRYQRRCQRCWVWRRPLRTRHDRRRSLRSRPQALAGAGERGCRAQAPAAPRRSAISPAGIWKLAMVPAKSPRSRPSSA